ncbi:Tut7 [Symbiodinium microadriaticum]|nr:Tut7 [Symbiodinium microadriaticum]
MAGDAPEPPEARGHHRAALPAIPYPARVQHVIRRVLQAASSVEGAEVRAFGSSVNGFGDSSSDVDVVLSANKACFAEGLGLGRVSKKDLEPRVLGKLRQELRKRGFTINLFIPQAKVPIIKLSLQHAQDRIDCDLSVNNLLPVFNTKLLKSYADLDLRLVELVQTCKAWARDEGVHGADKGNLSSYAFTLMVIFYMQMRGVLPCLQREALFDPVWYSEGGQRYNVAMEDAGDCSHPGGPVSFPDFARFYHDEFEWGERVVSVRTGESAPLEEYPDLRMKPRSGITDEEWDYFLHIEDPFDTRRNLNCVLAPGSNYRLWEAHHAEMLSAEPSGSVGGSSDPGPGRLTDTDLLSADHGFQNEWQPARLTLLPSQSSRFDEFFWQSSLVVHVMRPYPTTGAGNAYKEEGVQLVPLSFLQVMSKVAKYEVLHALSDRRADDLANILESARVPGHAYFTDGWHLSDQVDYELIIVEEFDHIISDSTLCVVEKEEAKQHKGGDGGRLVESLVSTPVHPASKGGKGGKFGKGAKGGGKPGKGKFSGPPGPLSVFRPSPAAGMPKGGKGWDAPRPERRERPRVDDVPDPGPLDEGLVLEIQNFVEERGGGQVEGGQIGAQFHGIKKSQLKPHFDIVDVGGGKYWVRQFGFDGPIPDEVPGAEEKQDVPDEPADDVATCLQRPTVLV